MLRSHCCALMKSIIKSLSEVCFKFKKVLFKNIFANNCENNSIIFKGYNQIHIRRNTIGRVNYIMEGID